MVCLSISGCMPLTSDFGSSIAVKINDDNQRIVILKKVAKRIVVLSPSFMDLLYAVDGKYYFTAKGKYYYRQMDRVLLTAAECALYGKPGLMEQAGQKMMGIMKNMK